MRFAVVAGCVLLSYVVCRFSGWPECGPGVQCLALGEKYQQGQSVPRDLAKAQRLFEKACSRGAVAGCLQAGWSYQRGDGGQRDPEKAASYFDRACSGHDADGCVFLARAYGSGLGVPKSEERAAKLMGQAVALHEQACRSGDRRACSRLFAIFATGDGVAREPSRATRFAERACLLGDQPACLPAGRWYLTGESGERDAKRAVDLLERACEGKGSGPGCCALATTYASGTGVVANPARAGSLFQKACSLGEGHACILSSAKREETSKRVGDALMAFAESCAHPYPPEACSRGCELNDPRSRERRDAALHILQAACDESDGTACLVLGLAYDQALGVKWDSEKARGFLEKACAANVPTACYRLAYLLSFGSGNLGRAQQLYRKACEAGLSAACDTGEQGESLDKRSPG